MKKTKTFTSTIDPDILAWVDENAKAKKTTRRAILEEAIRNYKQEIERSALREGLKRAAEDPDMVELAEWGMDDYSSLAPRK
jgi:predicted transcriptional regulator